MFIALLMVLLAVGFGVRAENSFAITTSADAKRKYLGYVRLQFRLLWEDPLTRRTVFYAADIDYLRLFEPKQRSESWP
jgi:hypothetical protein